MIVVAGPRIDPAIAAERPRDSRSRAYVHNLYRHLAACDLAVVQGGLTTAMELTANRRPFLYFPLRHHFEQNFHVRHRLERYGAGRRMDFDDSPARRRSPTAIAEEIGREVDYRPVETDGAPARPHRSRSCSEPRLPASGSLLEGKLRGPPSGRPRSALRAWVRKSGRRRRERRSACEHGSSTLWRRPGQRCRTGGYARAERVDRRLPTSWPLTRNLTLWPASACASSIWASS